MIRQFIGISIIQHFMRGRNTSVHGIVIEFYYPGIGGVVHVLGTIGDDGSLCAAESGEPRGDVGHCVMSINLHQNLLESVEISYAARTEPPGRPQGHFADA